MQEYPPPLQINDIKYITNLDNDFSDILYASIIGVDVEHSKAQGYDGKVCLIQLCANQISYVFDTVVIQEREKLQQLFSKIFTGEALKVFYAGTQDCSWILRDFQVEVKNMADIKDMAETLFSRTDNSLLGLWSKFCGYHFPKEQKKLLQKCDWLQRPLTDEQLLYSAIDSYYLPFLYEYLRNQFNEKRTEFEALQQKWNKPKVYKREQHPRSYYIKRIENLMEDILADFDDYYNTESYNQMYATEKALIKFIYGELCTTWQQYCIDNDLPMGNVDDEEVLQNTAVVLFKMLNIQGLQQMATFSDDKRDYKSKEYLQRVQESSKGKTYIQHKNYLVNGFMNCLQRDIDFVKWALTEVHYANANLQQQQSKLKENKKKQRKQEYNATCKNIYGDCVILGPDSMKLTNCTEKKGWWYVNKNKAELVQESPMIIKLNFEPSGFEVKRMEGDVEIVEKQFYTTERINQCVVCGGKSSLVKYNIIPPMYKQNMEWKFKIHKSHGFVLLCLKCQEKAIPPVEQLKEQLSKEYNVPPKVFTPEAILLKRVGELKKTVNQFKSKQGSYPEEVKLKFLKNIEEQVIEILNNPLSKPELKDSLPSINEQGQYFEYVLKLDQYLDLQNVNDGNIHGKLVMDQITSDEDNLKFIERWREVFLTSMKPKFLPDAWFIDGKPKSVQQEFLDTDQLKQNSRQESKGE